MEGAPGLQGRRADLLLRQGKGLSLLPLSLLDQNSTRTRDLLICKGCRLLQVMPSMEGTLAWVALPRRGGLEVSWGCCCCLGLEEAGLVLLLACWWLRPMRRRWLQGGARLRLLRSLDASPCRRRGRCDHQEELGRSAGGRGLGGCSFVKEENN